MFQEYDVVIATRQLHEKVPCETKGTILMVYNSNPVQYEVEFVDNEGQTLAIITLVESDIKKL